MLYLHTIVAYVVIGGALTAVLFYLSSTLLAVVYVSAPYKTPISRWIYSACYFPFTFSHWVLSALSVENIPSWITNHRQGYLTAYKREDFAVEKRLDLNYQAMNWLVRQVSISEDSRTRMVILVGELVHWDMGQLEFPEFSEGPWVAILNFLYFSPQQPRYASQRRTREETRAFFKRARARFDRSTSAFAMGLDRSTRNERIMWEPSSPPLYSPPIALGPIPQPRNKTLNHEEIRAFKKVWNAFDTMNTGYIGSEQVSPFLARLTGVFEVRIYPASHHYRVLSRKPTGHYMPTNLLLRQLYACLSSLNYEEIHRRRRIYNRVFWEARLLAERESRGISFLRMLVLLGYNRVMDEDKVFEIDEVIRGRAFAEELDTIILMDKVRSTFRMIYWRRKFLENKLTARTNAARATALE